MNYIGLDIATVTGMALYRTESETIEVALNKGDPISQYARLNNFLESLDFRDRHPVFLLEKPLHFRNANTLRQLVERYGYIKHSLIHAGVYRVEELNLNSVRKHLQCRSKEEVFRFFVPLYLGDYLTSDHTDAAALCLYQAAVEGHTVDLNRLKVIDWRKS